MKKIFFIISYIVIGAQMLFGQIPPGYYDNAIGREGAALHQALHVIIDNHTSISYTELWTAFQQTDAKPNGKVWDMYSDVPSGNPAYEFSFSSDQCGNYSGEGDCYNREHSFPESWYNDMGAPMKSDLFHLYPTDGYVNGRRSNHPMGEVGSVTWQSTNGSKVGTSNYPNYSGFTVFEPIDEYKGDFARSFFYIATRYYGQDNGWSENEMFDGANIKEAAIFMLLDWHETDPVSDKEINRNNQVYLIQGNRNPFIDHPIFANAIWDPEYTQIENNKQKFDVFLYPNPAKEKLKIHTSLKISKIQIIDVIGCVKKEIYITNSEKYQIDLNKFSNGIYFVNLYFEDNTFITKRVSILND
jgi:endonuclease I